MNGYWGLALKSFSNGGAGPNDPENPITGQTWWDATALQGLSDGASVATIPDSGTTDLPLVIPSGNTQPTYRVGNSNPNLLNASQSTLDDGLAISGWTRKNTSYENLSVVTDVNGKKWLRSYITSSAGSTASTELNRANYPSIRIRGGTTISASCLVRKDPSAPSRNAQIQIRFINNSGGVVGTGTSTSVLDTDGGVRITINSVSPSSAHFVELTVNFLSLQLNEHHFISDIAVHVGSSPTPFRKPLNDGRRTSPVLQFDGINNLMESADWTAPATRTEFWVIGYSSTDGSNNPIITAADTGTTGIIKGVNNVMTANGGAVITSDVPAGPLQIITVVYNGNNSKFRVNGVEFTGNIGTNLRAGVRIGGSSTVKASCEFAEGGIIPQILTPYQISQIEEELSQKHHIPILEWFDDFDLPAGTAPDPRNWTIGVRKGYTDGEKQWYRTGTDVVAHDGNSNMRLTCKRQSTLGTDGITYDFASGLLRSIGLVTSDYGEIVARIQVPRYLLAFPAFWTLSGKNEIARSLGGAWPQTGEIDIFESVNAGSTLFFNTIGPVNTTGIETWMRSKLQSRSDWASGFHVISAIWEPDRIVFRIDGRVMHEVIKSSLVAPETWPFNNNPNYILLNHAIGGLFPQSLAGTSTVDPSFTSADMLIDWVRVHEYKAPVTQAASTQIAAWGDSGTSGNQYGTYPVTEAERYTSVLSNLLNVPVHMGGYTGYASTDVAIHQGGVTPLITVSGNSIPASGSVNVTIISPNTSYMNWGSGTYSWTGTLAGIPGTLNHIHSSNTWTFVRTSSGTATPCPSGAPFICNTGAAHRNKIQLLWVGQNNLNTPAVSNPPRMDDIIRDTEMMVEYLTLPKRFLILGLHTSFTEYAAASSQTSRDRYNKVIDINDRQAEIYGENFVDLRRFLIDSGLQSVGLSPTANDLTDISRDTIPRQFFMQDNAHFTAKGYEAVAVCVAAKINSMGWL